MTKEPLGRTGAIDWIDDHPASAAGFSAVGIFLALRVWCWLSTEPILLARTDPELRATIYSQFASSAAAILGISVTVLAILIALPDRPQINDIRTSDTWPRIRDLLLVVGLLSLLVLIIAQLGTAIDTGSPGSGLIEQALIALATAGLGAFVIAGLTFALVLKRSQDPDDPSRGRGSGGESQG